MGQTAKLSLALHIPEWMRVLLLHPIPRIQQLTATMKEKFYEVKPRWDRPFQGFVLVLSDF